MEILKFKTEAEVLKVCADPKMNFFYADMSNDLYHSLSKNPNFIGHSSLCKYEKSALHYHDCITSSSEPTQAMIDGQCYHAKLESRLRQDDKVFSNDFFVAPEGFNRAKKDDKAVWEQASKINPKVRLIKKETNEQANKIIDSILKDKYYSQFFSGGYPELSVFARQGGTDVWVKVRADYYIPEKGVIVDAKFMADASKEQFTKSVFNFHYHIQAALYSDTFDKVADVTTQAFLFVVVEKTAPHGIGVYSLTDEAMEYGRALADLYLDKHHLYIQDCYKAKKIPDAYEKTIHSIDVPKWLIKDFEVRRDQ